MKKTREIDQLGPGLNYYSVRNPLSLRSSVDTKLNYQEQKVAHLVL